MAHPTGARQRFSVAKGVISPQRIGVLIYWQRPGRRGSGELTKGFRMHWKKAVSVLLDLGF
jgi:hypothetical protein